MSTASTACRFEEVERGVLVVAPRPELNEVQWSDIEQIGDGIVSRVGQRSDPRVVIDLSDLNFMGSAMVALVVRVWRTIEERGGRMAVYNKSPMVLEVLELAGLTRKWTMVESTDSGVRAVAGGRGGATGTSGGGFLAAAIAWLGLGIALGGLYAVLTPGTLAPPVAVLTLCVGGLIGLAAAVAAIVGGGTAAKVLAAIAGLGSAAALVGGVMTLAQPPAPPVAGDPLDEEPLEGEEEFAPEGDAEPLAAPDEPTADEAGSAE